MPLQMLQTGKGASTGSANMRPWFVRFRRWESGRNVATITEGFCVATSLNCVLASRVYANSPCQLESDIPPVLPFMISDPLSAVIVVLSVAAGAVFCNGIVSDNMLTSASGS